MSCVSSGSPDAGASACGALPQTLSGPHALFQLLLPHSDYLLRVAVTR